MKRIFGFGNLVSTQFRLALAQVIFRVSFVTFASLFFLDLLLPGFVTNWFNPVWILLIALITSIISQDKE